VRATSVATSSWSHGASDRRSITWTELPSSAARAAAACQDFSTSAPQVTIVSSSPATEIRPRPKGIW
jgi:acyl-CoA synthetase (AMP-forming)/AMP-acid ligase II